MRVMFLAMAAFLPMALQAQDALPGLVSPPAAVSSPATAQPLAGAPPAVGNAAPVAPPVIVDNTTAISGEWFSSRNTATPLLGMDLLLGQQTGIRPNLALYSNERSSFLIEGFYGALLTKFGASEGGGAGLRWMTSRGGCDAVTFSPGVDVLFNFDDGKATFLAPTIDIAWRHSFGNRAGLMLGLNAGVGVGLSGHNGDDEDGKKVSGKLTPLISFYTGLRY